MRFLQECTYSICYCSRIVHILPLEKPFRMRFLQDRAHIPYAIAQGSCTSRRSRSHSVRDFSRIVHVFRMRLLKDRAHPTAREIIPYAISPRLCTYSIYCMLLLKDRAHPAAREAIFSVLLYFSRIVHIPPLEKPYSACYFSRIMHIPPLGKLFCALFLEILHIPPLSVSNPLNFLAHVLPTSDFRNASSL